MTQMEQVFNHLQTCGSITPLEAQELFGCMRLGARIYDLKRQGHIITTERETAINRYGKPTHYARYRMGARA